MNDLAPEGAAIQTAMLDAISDAMSAALILYDRDDRIVFVSRRILTFFPLAEADLAPGTRLKDLLGALYDSCTSNNEPLPGREIERDEWIAEHLASHWKERSERTEQRSGDRWVRYTKRRLPSGIGVCVISDISEQKKREDQWRLDIERVQITEEILDTLPLSVFVKDRHCVYSAANRAGYALLQASPDMVLGRTVFDVHSHPLAERIDAIDHHVLKTGEPAVVPERITRLTGEEILAITRKQRVGKPGRYFIVTTMEDVTAFAVSGKDGRTFLPGLPELAFVESSYMDDEHHQASLVLKGRRVLLVCADARVGEAFARKLRAVGADSAHVQSFDEQKAFIEIASQSKLTLDLIVVDAQMQPECLDLPPAYGIDVMTADAFQMETGLISLLTRHFRSLDEDESANRALSVVHSETQAGTLKPGQRGCDVLVVEDNKINQIVFSQILEGFEIDYMLAATAQQALSLYDEQAPSLILMDTTLPDMDGFELSRRIRRLEADGRARTPIVGVVPLAFDGDRKTCLEAGMDEMVLKPISPDIIELLLERFRPRDSRQILR